MSAKTKSHSSSLVKLAVKKRNAALHLKESLQTSNSRRVRSVRFGSVTVDITPPSSETIKRNIEAGQSALSRAKEALVTKGVKIPFQKGVPLFYGDSREPEVMIREMNGVKTRGKVVNGSFRAFRQSAVAQTQPRVKEAHRIKVG